MIHPLQSMIGPDHSRPRGHSQGVDDCEQITNNICDMEPIENAENLARNLWHCFDEARFQDALPLLSDTFEAVWPNTRERILGAKNFIDMNEAYPGSWRCGVRQARVIPGGVVTVTEISDGAQALIAVSFFTVHGGVITRAEEYFGDVIDPPFDRSMWCERY
jgi:hypothetical protein